MLDQVDVIVELTKKVLLLVMLLFLMVQELVVGTAVAYTLVNWETLPSTQVVGTGALSTGAVSTGAGKDAWDSVSETGTGAGGCSKELVGAASGAEVKAEEGDAGSADSPLLGGCE